MANLAWVAATAGGKLVGADAGFDSVSTDTRSLWQGQLFVALRGPRHDASAFLPLAVERGAAGALVEQRQAVDLPQVEVADTGLALRQLATAWRQRFAVPVIAVTGSNGKTTVKEMLGAIMRAEVREPGEDGGVLVTWGNLNNHVGVPITLLWLRNTHRAAVVEMGASAQREIGVLAAIAQPTVGIITNAGPAHLAGFGGTIRDVATGKAELFTGLEAGAVAVVNRDDDYYGYWRSLRKDLRYRSFGLSADADYRAVNLRELGAGGLEFLLVAPEGEVEIHLPMAGNHNVVNALAAAAATLAAGAGLPAVRAGLGAMLNVAGRLRPEPGPAGSTIYDDSYNANPGSVTAAIRFLAAQAGQRWFVLGDMAELGSEEVVLHQSVGELAAQSGIDRFYCVGPLARHAATGFGSSAHWSPDVATLAAELSAQIGPDVQLLVKGSRSAGLERLVHALTGRFPDKPGSH